GPADDGLLRLGQPGEVERALQVRCDDLVERVGLDRDSASAQFHVGDGQRVLIACRAGAALKEQFGRLVERAVAQGAATVGQGVGQAGVTQASAAADQEQVARLDVAVL